jgi:hypothetical protein
MTLLSILLVGFLLGMKHAVESDHLAAVASLATRQHSIAATLRQGMAWGVGHAATLMLVGGAVLALGGACARRCRAGARRRAEPGRGRRIASGVSRRPLLRSLHGVHGALMVSKTKRQAPTLPADRAAAVGLLEGVESVGAEQAWLEVIRKMDEVYHASA